MVLKNEWIKLPRTSTFCCQILTVIHLSPNKLTNTLHVFINTLYATNSCITISAFNIFQVYQYFTNKIEKFHEYLVQPFLKSGGTNDCLRQVKVSGTIPYWKAWTIVFRTEPHVIPTNQIFNSTKISKSVLQKLMGVFGVKIPGNIHLNNILEN